MNTPSPLDAYVEEVVELICRLRKGSMDDKQFKTTVEITLTSTIERTTKENVKKLEGLKKEIPRGFYAQPVRAPSHDKTYNQAINTAIATLKQETK